MIMSKLASGLVLLAFALPSSVNAGVVEIPIPTRDGPVQSIHSLQREIDTAIKSSRRRLPSIADITEADLENSKTVIDFLERCENSHKNSSKGKLEIARAERENEEYKKMSRHEKIKYNRDRSNARPVDGGQCFEKVKWQLLPILDKISNDFAGLQFLQTKLQQRIKILKSLPSSEAADEAKRLEGFLKTVVKMVDKIPNELNKFEGTDKGKASYKKWKEGLYFPKGSWVQIIDDCPEMQQQIQNAQGEIEFKTIKLSREKLNKHKSHSLKTDIYKVIGFHGEHGEKIKIQKRCKRKRERGIYIVKKEYLKKGYNVVRGYQIQNKKDSLRKTETNEPRNFLEGSTVQLHTSCNEIFQASVSGTEPVKINLDPHCEDFETMGRIMKRQIKSASFKVVGYKSHKQPNGEEETHAVLKPLDKRLKGKTKTLVFSAPVENLKVM